MEQHDALKLEVSALNVQVKALKEHHKKHKAQSAVLAKFEKSWLKSLKQKVDKKKSTKKTTKKAKKAANPKTAESTVIPLTTPVEHAEATESLA